MNDKKLYQCMSIQFLLLLLLAKLLRSGHPLPNPLKAAKRDANTVRSVLYLHKRRENGFLI